MLSSLLRRRPGGPFTVEVEPLDWRFTVEPGQTVLQAALAQGLPWPNRCRVGSCTTCRCRVLEGELKSLTDPGYVLTQEQLAARTVLACQSQPRSNLRLHLERAAKPRPSATGDG